LSHINNPSTSIDSNEAALLTSLEGLSSGTGQAIVKTGSTTLGLVTFGDLTKSQADTYYYPLSTNPAGYLTDAPSDGNTYGRKNGAWTSVAGGSMVYPGVGVAVSTGSAWDTSLQVGVLAGNLIKLDGSAKLPAVDGSQLTNLPSGFTNPMTTLGDIIYENATPTADRLAGNTTTTKKYLQSVGSGGVAQAPSWQQIAYADISGTPSLTSYIAGPASATDNHVAVFDSTTGKLIKDGGHALSEYLTSLSGAAILAGINGGQTLNGGTLTTQILTLRANTADLTSGYVHFTDTTTASSTTVGAVVMDGGLAVAKKIYATDLNVTNTITGSVSGNAGTVTNGIYTSSQVTALAAVTVSGDKGKYLYNDPTTGVLSWATVASGGVTSVASGNGMDFTTITATGTVTMGTPSSITSTSTNLVSTTSHTHAIDSTILTTSTGAAIGQTMYIGTTSVAINRASAALVLTGITSIDGQSATCAGLAGSATVLATPRAIYGNNFDGSAALAQIIASTYGGTGNGFTKFTGPTTSEKSYALPNASDTIACLGLTQAFTGKNTFAPTVQTVTAMSAQAVDGSLGNVFTRTLAASETFTQSNFVAGQCFMVIVKQGNATTYTVTWFATITWLTASGAAPVQTTVSNGFTTYGFRCTGTNTFEGHYIDSN
jgi:hypothetical protein